MTDANETTPYRNVLSAAQERIAATITQIRNSIPHSGEIGALIEQSLRSHLEAVLPEKVGVSHGFVVDSNGLVSKQMDIVLYDRMNCPRLFSGSGAQMFPVESTYACGEVKTDLNSTRFKESLEKCSSYKALSRIAYAEQNRLIRTTYNLFGRPWDHWQSMFFVIGIESTALCNLQMLYEEFSVTKRLDAHLRVDTVMVLDNRKGENMLLNASGDLRAGMPADGSIDFLPNPGSRLCRYRAEDPWALFVMLLLRYMVQAPMETIHMPAYAGPRPF